MPILHNPRLTSAEIANLWNNYMNDSMSVCTFKYFLNTVEDGNTKELVQFALRLAEQHVNRLISLFQEEKMVIPYGFTDADVNVNAPRLFSDTFILNYIKQMAKIGLSAYGLALSLAARSDVVHFYNEAIRSTMELNGRATELSLAKGVYIRPTYMPVPKKVEYIQKPHILTDIFGEKRTLFAIEITHLYANVQTNALGKALLMGFAQTTPLREVRKLMVRGKELATKHIETFHDLLTESDVLTPVTWDGEITESTIPPFSDKLMVFQLNAINAAGISHYGTAISTSLRADLTVNYSRLMAETLNYAKDIMDVMIKNQWFEKPPQYPNHEALLNTGAKV